MTLTKHIGDIHLPNANLHYYLFGIFLATQKMDTVLRSRLVSVNEHAALSLQTYNMQNNASISSLRAWRFPVT